MMTKKDYVWKVSAAGRVNLIGEHVDYCGGKVLPAALSLCNTVYVRPNGTDKINLAWTDLPDRITVDLTKLDEYRNVKYANYPAGSAYIWQQAGHKLVGCDMLHECTVPFGSGLSSSAAIEVSTIAALATVAGEPIDPVEIALAAQKAEREYTGVNCGIMDQYASACGKKNHAILLDCKTLEREYVPIQLGDYALVIANCKKPHNLVESKYNERR
ncbi:MAG: galactokinase, partial [Candidatus Gallimonas sp.]